MSAPRPRRTADTAVRYAVHDCVCGHTTTRHGPGAEGGCVDCDCPAWTMTEEERQVYLDLSAKELIEFPDGAPRIPAVLARIVFDGLVSFETALHDEGWGTRYPTMWGVRLGPIGPRSELGIHLIDLDAPTTIWAAGEGVGNQLLGIRGLTHLIVEDPTIWPVPARRGLKAIAVTFEGMQIGAGLPGRFLFAMDVDGRFYAVSRDRGSDKVTVEMVHRREFLDRIAGTPVTETVPGILHEFVSTLLAPNLR